MSTRLGRPADRPAEKETVVTISPGRLLNRIGAVLAGGLVVVAAAAQAQQRPAPSAPAAAAGAVEPEAMAALDRMRAYLRLLKAFQVDAVTTKEDVLDDGQKVQWDGVVHLLAQTPNRLRAEVANDKYERMFFYDGKTFTLWARRPNYYATVAAPPTLVQLADLLEDKYGIEIPLVDLFRWGALGPTAGITSATEIGPSQIGGTTCQHYAFRQEGVDWQIWIQRGAYPLPRKLVITTTTDPARPQSSAVYTWNLAPSADDTAFTFRPPSDARRILMAENPAAGPTPAASPKGNK